MNEYETKTLIKIFGEEEIAKRNALENLIRSKLVNGYSIAKYGLILEDTDKEKPIADIRFSERKIILSRMDERCKILKSLLDKERIFYREFGYWKNSSTILPKRSLS